MRNVIQKTVAGTHATRREAFLEGMSRMASTVNIVTTDGAAGRAGVTVSAMSPLSADSTPAPSLLICVHHASAACEAIRRNGCFCVNVLAEDQVALSDVFAGRTKTPDGDKFAVGDWQAHVTGAPVLGDPLAAFDCTLTQSQRMASHMVFFGIVEDVVLKRGGRPLVYANRSYGRVDRLAQRNLTAAA